MRQSPREMAKLLSKLPYAQHNQHFFYQILAEDLNPMLEFAKQLQSQPVIHILDGFEIPGTWNDIPSRILHQPFPTAIQMIVKEANLNKEQVMIRKHSEVGILLMFAECAVTFC